MGSPSCFSVFRLRVVKASAASYPAAMLRGAAFGAERGVGWEEFCCVKSETKYLCHGPSEFLACCI